MKLLSNGTVPSVKQVVGVANDRKMIAKDCLSQFLSFLSSWQKNWTARLRSKTFCSNDCAEMIAVER